MINYPTVVSPSNQAILTVSVAFSISVYAPSDSAVDLYVNAIYFDHMSNAGGGYFSYSWTPGATASSIELYAIGNVTGQGSSIIVTVDNANTVNTDITTWTKSNAGITVTGGQTDPFGGTNAYLVTLPTTSSTSRGIWKTASSTPTEVLNGFEMWVKPYGGLDKFYVPTQAGTAKGVYVDLTNKYTKTIGPCAAIVEQIGNWYRVQISRVTGSYTTDTFYWYFCQTFGSITLNISAGQSGTLGLYFYAPRMVGTVSLPFTLQQKFQWYLSAVTADYEEYKIRHQYLNSNADYDGTTAPAEVTLRAIKPSGWSSANKYRCLIALPALSDFLETNVQHAMTATEAMVDGGFADLYNIVVLIVYDRNNGASYWWASNSDGTNNGQDYVADIVTTWAQEQLAVTTDKNNIALIGYSKSAWAGMSMILRRPDRIGAATLWDGNYNQVWDPALFAGSIDTEAQFNAYNPLTIMNSTATNSIGDTRRVLITGGVAWIADYFAMLNSLNTNDISYYTRNHSEARHVWLTAWTSVAVEQLIKTWDNIPDGILSTDTGMDFGGQ